MGRKRNNAILPGKNYIIHLPVDIDITVLEYINNQANFGGNLTKILTNHVKGSEVFHISQNQHRTGKKLNKKPGDNYTLYIPLDIDLEVIMFLNNQKVPGKSIIHVLTTFIKSLKVADTREQRGVSQIESSDVKARINTEIKQMMNFQTQEQMNSDSSNDEIPDCYLY